MNDLVAKLIRLDGLLRSGNIEAGPGHHIQALQLLSQLERQGVDLTSCDAVAAYLGPVYCGSEEQQREFPQWLARAWAPVEPSPRPLDDKKSLEQTEESKAGGTTVLLWAWAPGIVILSGLAAFALLIGLAVPRDTIAAHVDLGNAPCAFCGVRVTHAGSSSPLAGLLTSAEGNVSIPVRPRDMPVIFTADPPCEGVKPVSTAPIAYASRNPPTLVLQTCPPPTIATQAQTTGRWQAVAALQPRVAPLATPILVTQFIGSRLLWVLSPLLLAALWWLYWHRMRGVWLARVPERMPRNIRELSAGARFSLAAALGWRDMGHELRRREWVASDVLDVEATLQSLLSTGIPRLVFGSRVEPEYLVLIDESSPGDHLARFGDDLLLFLEHRDMALSRYYFRGSPMRCVGPAASRKPRGTGLDTIDLDELLARHRGHRVIVISDGSPLFDRGQIPLWLELLAQARQPALLTLLPREAWGWRERALFQLGFTVLPLTPRGLEQLGETYGCESLPSVAAGRTAVPRWMTEPLAMLMPAPPERMSPKTLCEQLHRELGEAAYRLAQAVAVYPEIHWGLTTRIGAEVLTQRQLADALPRLGVLPWFRRGHMPEWLRRQLAGTQSRESWGQAHQAITKILDAVRQDAKGPVPLRVALEANPWGCESLLQILRDPLSLLRKPILDDESLPRRDAVFLRFLQGPVRLSVRAGDILQRVLFAGGVWLHGARLLPALILALAATGILAWQRPLLMRIPGRQLHPGSAPEITALAGPFSDGRVLVGYSNGQVWSVNAAGAAPLPAHLEKGIGRIVYRDNGRIEITDVGGQVLDLAMSQGSSGKSPIRPGAVPYAAVVQGRLTLTFKGKPLRLPPQLTASTRRWLCAGPAAAAQRLLVVAADAEVLTVRHEGADNVTSAHFMARPPNVSFDGCRVQERFIVGWRNQPQEVWRARIAAPGEGFTQTLLKGHDASKARELLTAPDPTVWETTGPGEAAIARQLASLLESPDSKVQQSALQSVDKMGGAGAVFAPQVAALLNRPDSEIRESALQALGKMGAAGAAYAPQVAALLKSPDSLVLESALHALGKMGAAGAVFAPQVATLLKNPDPNVRELASQVLGNGGTAGAAFGPQVESSGSPITDAMLSDNERTLFLRRGPVIEVHGPDGSVEGEVEAPGSLLSSSVSGLKLVVASNNNISLWESPPDFPWPPSPPSARVDIDLRGRKISILKDIDDVLRTALDRSGYTEIAYYLVPGNGFALVTRLERINPDGSPATQQRYPTADGMFSLQRYLSAMFLAPKGYYREIAFIVSQVPLASQGKPVLLDEAASWLEHGAVAEQMGIEHLATSLPEQIAKLNMNANYHCTALIYEFQRRDVHEDPIVLLPGRLSGEVHLVKSGLAAALGTGSAR